VALTELEGPRIVGLPADRDGFIPVDAHGRVGGAAGVFAAGDATAFPISTAASQLNKPTRPPRRSPREPGDNRSRARSSRSCTASCSQASGRSSSESSLQKAPPKRHKLVAMSSGGHQARLSAATSLPTWRSIPSCESHEQQGGRDDTAMHPLCSCRTTRAMPRGRVRLLAERGR
jgi:hypothetical protein